MQFFAWFIMDGGWYQLESIRSAASHIETKFAAVMIGLCHTVDDGGALKLRKNHQNLHDELTVRGGGVEGFLRRYKLNTILLKLLHNIHEISKRAADTIQFINDNLFDLSLTNQLHHGLKAITIDIAAGEAVIDQFDELFSAFIGLDHHFTVFQLCFTADAVFPLYRFASI